MSEYKRITHTEAGLLETITALRDEIEQCKAERDKYRNALNNVINNISFYEVDYHSDPDGLREILGLSSEDGER